MSTYSYFMTFKIVYNLLKERNSLMFTDNRDMVQSELNQCTINGINDRLVRLKAESLEGYNDAIDHLTTENN